MTAKDGGLVEGTVVRLASYGAFVELPSGEAGLVHVSEVADSYVSDVGEHVRVGDKVTVRVLGVDEKGRYKLSLKRARPDWEGGRPRGGGASSESFEEKMKRFMKESQERLLELKRNTEAKRGRGRRG